jgi:hypothetical protein
MSIEKANNFIILHKLTQCIVYGLRQSMAPKLMITMMLAMYLMPHAAISQTPEESWSAEDLQAFSHLSPVEQGQINRSRSMLADWTVTIEQTDQILLRYFQNEHLVATEDIQLPDEIQIHVLSGRYLLLSAAPGYLLKHGDQFAQSVWVRFCEGIRPGTVAFGAILYSKDDEQTFLKSLENLQAFLEKFTTIERLPD